MFILVIIDAFSRWVELYPTKTTTAVETASCIFQHFGRFGTPEVVHTDRGTAFHNELVEELLRMSGTEQSLTTAYSSEENGIVERANQEVLRHLNAILFDSRVHDRWSFVHTAYQSKYSCHSECCTYRTRHDPQVKSHYLIGWTSGYRSRIHSSR
jgi:transposase InsO family protein